MGIASTVERAAHLVGAYLDSAIGDLRLTQGEAHVLGRLAIEGAATIGELHAEFGHKRSTLTNIIDRLERRGHVRRRINPDDRRSFVIDLTASGCRVAKRVAAVLDALDDDVLAHIRERDLEGMTATVDALDAVVETHAGRLRGGGA